jgi:hypothetical protein
MRKTARSKKTVAFQLFQASGDFFWMSLCYGQGGTEEVLRHAYLTGFYELVHTFIMPREDLLDRLEEVFYRSQNLDQSWRKGRPCRSTCVGDIVRVEDEFWIVASEGFKLGWRDSELRIDSVQSSGKQQTLGPTKASGKRPNAAVRSKA